LAQAILAQEFVAQLSEQITAAVIPVVFKQSLPLEHSSDGRLRIQIKFESHNP